MKRIKIVAIALFTLATIVNVNAQDSNNPWAVSAGINSVDVYGGSEFFNDWLGFGIKMVKTITISSLRYLELLLNDIYQMGLHFNWLVL